MEQDNWNIIASVLANDPSEEERQQFDTWLKENSKNREVFDVLNQVGYTGDLDHIQSAKDDIYKKIVKKAESKRKQLRFIQYAAAASVALLLGIGGWLYFNLKNNQTQEYVEARVPYGKMSKVTLPDGTIVNLNSCSSLKFPKNFKGQNNRSVQLQGEGYFEVTKDSKHPFIVNTGSVNIKVLGTHFNVKAYPDESLITATLLEGAIAVSVHNNNLNKELKLVPNQQVIFDKKHSSFTVQNVDAQLFSGWKEGNFYFDRDSLTSIFKQLERNYNVRIIIRSDYLKSQIFSGSISNDENIYEILDMMKYYKSFGYKVYKDSIVLFDK